MTALQLILILLTLVVLIATGVIFIYNQEKSRKNRVLSVVQRGQSHQKTTDQDDPNKRRADLAQKLKESKAESDGQNPGKSKTTIKNLIEQAGLNWSSRNFWTLSVATMTVLALLAQILGQSPFVVIMAAVIGFFGVPRFILKKMAARRQKQFLEEFPDALEATVRLLKAGMPVSEAILMISKEYDGPVGEEMSRVYDKQKIGITLHEAAYEATKRMPLPEMKMFATGLAIQAQTGASLSEVLINLSNVIRARFRLKRKIKALSAEAVVSASIIGALPNFVAGSLYFVNREYIEILFTDSFGKILLAGAVIWMLIGVVIMKAMINFKV